jgi:DNA-binding transcriptional LysR family regulator
MQHMNLKNLDLNLLLLFDVLMNERNVTKAAQKLNLSQAGMSHALARLRASLGDELFVRRQGNMQPTPRAVRLKAPLEDALARLNAALSADEFSPENSKRTFRIIATDYFSSLFLPNLIRKLEAIAPDTEIKMIANRSSTIESTLSRNEVDLAIGNYKNRMTASFPLEFKALDLYEDSYVCLMRKDHPMARKTMSRELYLDAKHVHLSPTGDSEYGIERYLTPRGFRRRIGLTINHYLVAPLVLEKSDMIWTAPERIARHFLKNYSLCVKKMPISIPPAVLQIVWATEYGDSLAHHWLRDLIKETCVTTNEVGKPSMPGSRM